MGSGVRVESVRRSPAWGRWGVPMAGLLLSGLVVAALALASAAWADAARRAEMRDWHGAIPPYREAVLLGTEERWENSLLYRHGDGVFPRVVSAYHSEHPVGAVVTFYREHLLAEGWEEYREPWALYSAYRRGPYRVAVLFRHPFAQDWLPAERYELHLWAVPLLDDLLGREQGD